MLDLIIKNGQCYINGKLEDKDIAVKDGKILKIGQISEEAKEVYDAKNKITYRAVYILRLTSENRVLQTQRIFTQEVEQQ